MTLLQVPSGIFPASVLLGCFPLLLSDSALNYSSLYFSHALHLSLGRQGS